MPGEYTGFNWPRRQVWYFTLPELADTDMPYYVTGNAGTSIKPAPGWEYNLRRVILNANFTAAGTAVVLTCKVYKTSVDPANAALTATTIAESDDGDDVFRQDNVADNTATDMDHITSADGIIIEIDQSSASTFTLTKGGLVALEIDYL
jgi:hypothetical protein